MPRCSSSRRGGCWPIRVRNRWCDNVAGQWLLLRQLESVSPATKEFDGNLRWSFKRETELLFETILREDRSVVDLIDADYTFVDERLARHYGIPNIRGSRFRRVAVEDDARRGLLGHGSLLTVTSAGNRTSPVKRGKWILENLLGAPVPLPPPGVETNLEAKGDAWRRDHLAAPAAGAAPGQSELRVVPCGDGPDWFRARELRPDRHVAGGRRRRAGQRLRHARGWHRAQRPGEPPAGAARPSRGVRRRHH